MGGFWSLMQWPLLGSLLMSPVHCLFGMHIVRRGVIFIDLAVAQMAALGMAIALAGGHEINDTTTYFLSLGFALGTALVIALSRFKLGRVPHEAIIGIIFVMASAMGIVVLEGTAHGLDELHDILSGSILLIQRPEVEHIALIYATILAVVLLLWRPITSISLETSDVPIGMKRIAVDFVFYALLAFVVASSVKVAGVLSVFTWLVMPPVAVFLWLQNMKWSIVLAILISLIGTTGAMFASYYRDLPTGPAIVIVLSAIVGLLYLAKIVSPVKDVLDAEVTT